jgi:hypothetical protein
LQDPPLQKKPALIPSFYDSLYIPFKRYGIVGLTDGEMIKKLPEFCEFVKYSLEKYSSVTSSCQEYVVLLMYLTCHPIMFNMSDTKALIPFIILMVFICGGIYGDYLIPLAYQLICTDLF